METAHKQALVWCVSSYQIALNTSPSCRVTALLGAVPSPFPTRRRLGSPTPSSQRGNRGPEGGQSPPTPTPQFSLTAGLFCHDQQRFCSRPDSVSLTSKFWDKGNGFVVIPGGFSALLRRTAERASSQARTWSQTILWYTSCLMLISTSNSESFLSASVLAARMSLQGETCWGKSSMFRRTGKT